MALHIVKQPNGKYAIWNSAINNFVEKDRNKKEIIDFFVNQAIKETKAHTKLVINAIENGKDMLCDYETCMELRDE